MKKYKITYIVIICVILISTNIISYLLPLKERSDLENRKLSKMPELNVENLLSGEYFTSLEDYLIDHIAFRDYMTDLLNTTKVYVRQNDLNGVIFGYNDALFRKSEFNAIRNSNHADAFGKTLNSIEKTTSSYGGKTYYIHTPNHNEFFLDDLPEIYGRSEYEEIYNKYNNDLLNAVGKTNVNIVNAANVLAQHKDEGVYFKTDHHWTFKGAYYAYLELLTQINKTSSTNYSYPNWEDLNLYRSDKQFMGSVTNLLGSTKYLSVDKFEYALPYDYPKTSRITNDKKNKEGLFYLDNEYDKYDNILGYNKAKDNIYSNVGNDKTILFIGYSYKRALMPLAAYNFNRVLTLDPRYYKGNINSYINKHKPDYVVIVRDELYYGNKENVSKINK